MGTQGLPNGAPVAEEEDEDGNISDMLAERDEDDPEAKPADDAYEAEALRRAEAEGGAEVEASAEADGDEDGEDDDDATMTKTSTRMRTKTSRTPPRTPRNPRAKVTPSRTRTATMCQGPASRRQRLSQTEAARRSPRR